MYIVYLCRWVDLWLSWAQWTHHHQWCVQYWCGDTLSAFVHWLWLLSLLLSLKEDNQWGWKCFLDPLPPSLPPSLFVLFTSPSPPAPPPPPPQMWWWESGWHSQMALDSETSHIHWLSTTPLVPSSHPAQSTRSIWRMASPVFSTLSRQRYMYNVHDIHFTCMYMYMYIVCTMYMAVVNEVHKQGHHYSTLHCPT